MAGNTQNLTLGRGRLYFNRFASDAQVVGTGSAMLYMGNTPKVDIEATNTMLDHYDSDEGTKIKDDAIILESTYSVTFDLDEADMTSFAVWFGGDSDVNTIAEAPAVVQTGTMFPGSFLQLGVSTDLPFGTQTITVTSVTAGSAHTACVMGTDYAVDPVNAIVQALPDSEVITGGIDDVGTEVTVTYDQLAVTQYLVVDEGDSVLGELTYIANNPAGPNRSFFVPRARVVANGTFALKGDTWEAITFKCECLLPPDGRRRIYFKSASA